MKNLFVRFAAVVMLAAGVIAIPATATAHSTCETDEDVPFVIEYGALDGEDQILCGLHGVGKTAMEALHDAGVETDQTNGSMPMLCRIGGQPTPQQEKCTNELSGSGYWAFMVAKEGQDWGYAQVGMQDYELTAGDYVAVVYHQLADGQDVKVTAAADAQTRADAVVPGADDHAADDGADASDAADDESDDSSFSQFALPVALLAVVLVGAAAFVVARRRR